MQTKRQQPVSKPDTGTGQTAPNYITPEGFQTLRSELKELLTAERPKVVDTVHWAAKNGDRSENGDYIYGRKRLREIDRRVRFLTRRLEAAQVVNPSVHNGSDRIFFGATVLYAEADGSEHTVRIVGVDESSLHPNGISWVAPLARQLLQKHAGDVIQVRSPQGVREVEVLEVCYAVADSAETGVA